MNLIESIKDTIRPELELFDKTFVTSMETDNPILESVNGYIFQRAGKKLRPILVILAAKLVGDVNMSTIHGAIAMELLHTASLVHDDVIDDTYERRGSPSVNARWGNKVAVLSGDYMLSGALFQVVKTANIDVLNAVSFIGSQLSDGELLQLNSTRQSKISEAEYFRIIQKKTAFLFSVCTEVGALSVNSNRISIEHLKKYGEYLGYCFQIKDDIFDYYRNVDIGKPTGNDIRDGKVTLPLIYALENADDEERRKILTWINLKDYTREHVAYITNFALKNGGVEYARKRMEEYKNKAIEELNGFEDNQYKKALINCVEFAVTREK
ncbi:MAG: polyprenyl synthetase family protein [Paludibacter sp.]|nr:polyprenyl synthetase family protein [Paludibacter sp.]MDD4198011.1 polyprenyl synthetase family protein [Paludibacter sp.]MDD4428581.1 polyprenyl synthetase family protein [Paludibacter sp.]